MRFIFWKYFVDADAEALFQFVTGSVDPPVEEEAITVVFNLYKTSQKYLEARTCNSELILPQGNKTVEEFTTSITQALEMSKQGFGNA